MTRRDRSIPFFRALNACVGTPLEESARDVLTPIVVPLLESEPGVMTREIAHTFDVSYRSANRLLAAYGWSNKGRRTK